MYGKTLEQLPDRFEAFESALSDLEPASLEAAFRACLRTCTEFPTPANVRSQLANAEKHQDQFEAEKTWELVKQTLRRHWYGELMPVMVSKRPENYTGRIQEYGDGFLLHAPPFDAATDYAIRNVGGLERIATASGKEQDFIRRDFLTAVTRHRETLGLTAPSREEAKAFLDSLKVKELSS